jgi:transcriptional regulator with XRE-family HTH domain
MDVAAALALLHREADRSSQAAVARVIGVSKATVTGWKQGATPQGDQRAKLLAWAEGIPDPPPVVVDDYRRGLADAAERMAALVEILRSEAHGTDPRLLAADAPMPSERDAGRGTAPAAGAPPRAPRRARGL